jgi:hypothetical protein
MEVQSPAPFGLQNKETGEDCFILHFNYDGAGTVLMLGAESGPFALSLSEFNKVLSNSSDRFVYFYFEGEEE